MAHEGGEYPDEPGADVSSGTLKLLEKLDSRAHVVVAGFFLVLAGAVLVAAVVEFWQSLLAAIHGNADTSGTTFVHSSLEVLSTLLFAVIILELLRTIITYLQTRDIKAIMKEFLIVGIISSIRKILMVGAESSIITNSSEGPAATLGSDKFVQESVGVVLSVIAILLMIGGLILLNRYYAKSGGDEGRGQEAGEG